MTPTAGIVEQLDALGGFFAVELHDAAVVPSSPWRAMAELVEGDAVLNVRIERVRAALAAAAGRPVAEIEPRVAASITHLGLAARLIGPTLAIAALAGQAATPPWPQLWWRDELGGAVPISVPSWSPLPLTAAQLSRRLHEYLVDATVARLARTVARCASVSDKVLTGNVASALNGAAHQLTRLRPDRAEAIAEIADAVLADPVLNPIGSAPGAQFRRDSCCLIYRVAEDRRAVCADCVLR